MRISGSQLGYDTDLDFVFPVGDSVFKAGDDLSDYHGGLSLQELVVRVVLPQATMEKAFGQRKTAETIGADCNPPYILNRGG